MNVSRLVPVAVAALLASGGTASAARLGAPPVSAFTAEPPARLDLIDLGRAPAATPVSLAVMLKYRNQAELDQLVRLQATPHSPLFHHFITRAQFAAEFAPAPADYLRVVRSLRAAGFTVRPGLPNRTIVDADGTASATERFFGTQIHRVGQTGYGIRYANATPATVPAAIADVVRSVSGLDDVIKMKSHRMPAVNDGATPFVSDAVSPDIAGPIERTTNGSFAGLYPTAIAKAYDYPAQHAVTGAGHSIAIVIDSDIENGNLTTFWKAAKITRAGGFYRVLVEGSNPGVTADLGETAIDTETSSSLAPGADIYLYLMPNLSDKYIEDAYNLAVANNVVDVTSSSFGGCETKSQAFADATNAIAEQGASEGMSFTASTGDSGGVCETAPGNFATDVVNIPAANPYFLGIGGTTLGVNKTTGKWVSETAWSPGGENGGSGGGVSSYIPLPSYQAGVPGIAVVPAKGPKPGFAGRNIPDISLDASNHPDSYVAVYAGGWTGYGGTSVSNPMFAALLTEVNQEQGSYSGWFNPSLYYYEETYGYGTAFRDITSGATDGGWSAKAGYDQSTGWGSIKSGFVLGSY